MSRPAGPPIRKVTLNLYEDDIEYLREAYGWGWSEQVRDWVHEKVAARKLFAESLEESFK